MIPKHDVKECVTIGGAVLVKQNVFVLSHILYPHHCVLNVLRGPWAVTALIVHTQINKVALSEKSAAFIFNGSHMRRWSIICLCV